MKKQWRNKNVAAKVSFKEYLDRVYRYCASESIGSGALGNYLCYVMMEMSDEDLRRRVEASELKFKAKV